MRVAAKVNLTEEQSSQLKAWARGRKTPARLVRRAQIVLLAAEGKQNKEIGSLLGVMPRIVAMWRQRFLDHGVVGLEKDAPRSGRKPTLSEPKVRTIVRRTTQETPRNATHWSTRSMTRAEGASAATVRRIWQRHGLKPHLIRTFKLSRDPHFVERF